MLLLEIDDSWNVTGSLTLSTEAPVAMEEVPASTGTPVATEEESVTAETSEETEEAPVRHQ